MKTAKKQKSPSVPSAREAAQEAFLPVLRELARAYQAFTHYSAAHLRTLGLTPAQFDVISTLGNTEGMPFNRLAEKTLITKGTLTGIIDRLEARGLVRREPAAEDRRSLIAVLTPAGQALFETVFPAHIAHLRARFEDLGKADLTALRSALKRVRTLF